MAPRRARQGPARAQPRDLEPVPAARGEPGAGSTCRADKRRLAGVRLMESANPEEEAQAIALLVREALEEPEKRVAVVTPDRGLAGAGRRSTCGAGTSRPTIPPAARWRRPRPGGVLLLLAEVAAEQAAPVPLMALLEHPLVRAGEARARVARPARARSSWRCAARAWRPGSSRCARSADEAGVATWWGEVEAILAPLHGRRRGAARPTSSTRSSRRARRCAARRCGRRPTGARCRAFVEELRAARARGRHRGSIRPSCPPCCARRWTASRCARPRAAIRAWRSTACSNRA